MTFLFEPGVRGNAGAAEDTAAAAILQDMRQFREMGSVLYIAAHPDDENTQLLTWLARGKNYRTAYLSLTRGDGGQNVLGPEFGEDLGVLRTQELLAARRLDGARQFFSRAIDFGFSKDAKETLKVWNRQEVLADIVRMVRTFRPDVVITRFPPDGGGHGHHTASAVLAVEAFPLCGNAQFMPERLGRLAPWQPKRLLQNGFPRGGSPAPGARVLQLDVSGTDPVTGEPFADIAGRSRSMHKTQGFGSYSGSANRGPRMESFQLLAGEPVAGDIFDGVDTAWSRVPGGTAVGQGIDAVIRQFHAARPAASVPALLSIRKLLAGLAADPVIEEKRQRLDRIIQGCLGLAVETLIPEAEVVPGEKLSLKHNVTVRSDYPVRWLGVRYPGLSRDSKKSEMLAAGRPAVREAELSLPAEIPLSQPYWLRSVHPPGMFQVDNPDWIGRPENPPALAVEFQFEVDGQTLVLADEPVQASPKAEGAAARRRMEVISPVPLQFQSEVRLFAPGASRNVEIEIRAIRPEQTGDVRLEVPSGWRVSPASHKFRLHAVGDKAAFSFTLQAPSRPADVTVTASARIGGRRYGSRRMEIRYDHLAPQLLQPAAGLKAVSLDLRISGSRVGYVPGAGDRVAECLEEMGYKVSRLTGADLTPERLREFDAVVIGIRAFNVRTDLAAQMPALFAFAEAGGTVVVQYNNPNGLKASPLAPYDLQLSQDRVTDENAEVTFLTPEHLALNAPNRIASSDFEGWVQERGLYFPGRWDSHFTPILSCGDSGEAPLKSGLLVARHGKGYYVYTGLAWFRQLPAGVPGAYRLFANLVSLGK